MSMIGYGGKNILANVKTSISNYVDKVQDGDTITFVTFDSKVKEYPTINIDGDGSREAVKKFISVTEAKGKWTYTFKMMETSFALADRLQNDNGNQTVVVMMTDGLDDPPPGYQRYRQNFKKLYEKYQGKNWWIYLVSFADFKKNQEKIRNRIAGLKKISDKTKVISGDPANALDKDLQKDLKIKERSNPVFIILIILLIAACGAAGFILFKRMKVGKVEGYLEYWNNDLLDPLVEFFDITRHMTHEIVIGNTFGCTLNIHDLESTAPVVIKATREGALRIETNSDEELSFVNKDDSMVLEDGDIFKISNFTFKYYKSAEDNV